jgi:glycerophosphoryl diester phosphodiesterase
MKHKVLSHRLRGYDVLEHTRQAMLSACKDSVKYLELDLRANRDGDLYINHDPSIQLAGKKTKFKTLKSSICNRLELGNNRRLLRFEEVLQIFENRIKRSQILCLDIKDGGYEADILSMVRQYCLEQNVYYISWYPQVLIKLRDIGADSPLFLSHCNLTKFGFLGKAILFLMGKRVFRFFNFILISPEKYYDQIEFIQGYQHCYLCNELPGSLCDVLRDSQGGVSVHTSQINSRFIRYCQKENLKIWTFSVKSFKQFKKYAKMEEVDVVFCDDAPLILGYLNRSDST